MTLSKYLVTALSLVIIHSAYANPSYSPLVDTSAIGSPSQVLPAGAKLVAGNPKENEFFIVAANDAAPIAKTDNEINKPASVAIAEPVVKKTVPIIRTAQLSKPHEAQSRKMINKLRQALNQPSPSSKAGARNTYSQAQAQLKTKHALHVKFASNKKVTTKVKMAINTHGKKAKKALIG